MFSFYEEMNSKFGVLMSSLVPLKLCISLDTEYITGKCITGYSLYCDDCRKRFR